MQQSSRISVASPPTLQSLTKLTKKEQAVVHALMDNNISYKELGEALNMSWRTAQTHVQNISRKWGVRGKTQIVLKAIKEGL